MSRTVARVTDTLCETCYWATCLRRAGTLVAVHCNEMGRSVRVKIDECTSYRGKRAVSKDDYEQIAWVLKTNPSRSKVGFTPPKNRRDEE